MNVCLGCGATAADRWKFCLRCGTPLAVTSLAAEPAAWHDDEEFDESSIEWNRKGRPRARPDIPLLLGVLLGITGIMFVSYLALTLT